MEEKKVSRLILKEDDILVVYLPDRYFSNGFRHELNVLYKHVKDRLIETGKKNKILLLPIEMKLGVIGKKEVKEIISQFDLWNLFNIDEEEL